MARHFAVLVLGLLAVASANAGSLLEAPIDCANLDAMLEEIGAAQSVSTLSNEYPLVTNDEEWSKRCEMSRLAIKQLKKVNSQCYKENHLTNQVISAMAKTRLAMLEEACKPGSDDFKDSVAVSKCIKDNAFNDLKEAEKKILTMSQIIVDMPYPDDKARTMRACCTVEDARKLMVNVVKKDCGKYQSIIDKHADSYTSEAMGLICGGVDKTTCDKLEPLKLDGVQLKSMSYIVPAIKAVKAMDHA